MSNGLVRAFYGNTATWPSVMDQFFGSTEPVRDRLLAPRTDVYETGEAYHISMELPGVKKEAVELSVQDGILTIKGELPYDREDDDKTHYYRRERRYGAFERSWTLPENIDQEHIGAAFKDGILTLTLTKAPEAKPRRIDITIA